MPSTKNSKYIVLPANHQHAVMMSPHMRKIDREEVWAATGLTSRDALEHSVDVSAESYSVFMEGVDHPVMMFGVCKPASLLDRNKQIWMLGTPDIEKMSMKFLRSCDDYIKLMAGNDTVYNYVLEGNTKTLNWLHWLGFTILKPKPYGILHRNFHYIERKTPCVAQQQLQ